MNKLRTAIRLAKGKWVNAKYVQEFLNIDIFTIMCLFQFKYTGDEDNIDDIYVRIIPKGDENEKK